MKISGFTELKTKIIRNRLLPLVMIFVLMFVQIVALFVISERQKLDVYDNRANNELEQCVAEFDNIFENLQRALVSARLDHEIIVALSDPKTDALEKQRAFLKLNTNKKFVSEIKNIYVFNEKHGGIYSTLRPYVTLEDFPFGKTKEILLDKNTEIQSLLIVDKADYFGEYYGRERVFRLLMKCDSSKSNYIMADVDFDVVNRIFRDFEKNMEGKVYIRRTGDGEILYGNEGNDGIPLELFDVKLEENKAMRTYHGKKYLVTHKQSKRLGVEIYSIIPESKMHADNFQTRTLLMINLVIISVVVLSVLFLLLFRSLRMTAMENARKLEESRQTDRRERLLKKYEPVISCLRHPTTENIREGIQFIRNISPEGKEHEIALVRIDFFGMLEEPLTLRKKYEIMSRVEEKFTCCHKSFMFYEKDNYAFVLLVNPDFDYVAKCGKLYHEFRQYFSEEALEPAMYVSSTGDVSKLNELCAEVANLAEYKFIYNRPMFLDFTTLLQQGVESEQWLEGRIVGIKANIMTPDENLSLQIENFIMELRSLGAKQAKKAIHTLYFAIAQCIDQITREDMKFRLDLSGYFSRVSSLESLDDAEVLFSEIVDKLQARRAEEDGNKYTVIVKRTLKFIEDNIGNPALCRSMIADEIGMSKPYLSRIFKEIVGISISDAINDMRIKMVEEQLVTTNRSIKDIISDVGIVNQSYFTVTFKKKHGMSPSDYRDKKSK